MIWFPNIYDKAVQSNILWLGNQQIKNQNPSFHINLLADAHALKQHRLSQCSSLVCSSLVLIIASSMHLEPESEKVDFHAAKNAKLQATLFRYF